MFKRALLALAVLSAASPAMAQSSWTSTIELRGYVPVICRATLHSAPAFRDDGVVELGSLDEFCNAGSGYRVVVDYAPGEDPGQLLVDGREVPLDRSGRTVIAQVSGPSISSRNLAYVPSDRPIAALSIHVETASV